LIHRWQSRTTKQPAHARVVALPLPINKYDKKDASDFYWVVRRMSIDAKHDGIEYGSP
jgi:hypothetical protein